MNKLREYLLNTLYIPDAVLDVDTEVNPRDLWEPIEITFYCGQKTEQSK